MSTETTNKKIKIDNGTTFGRTYTDKAVDELLKNAGGGGEMIDLNEQINLDNNTITQSGYNLIQQAYENNTLLGISFILFGVAPIKCMFDYVDIDVETLTNIYCFKFGAGETIVLKIKSDLTIIQSPQNSFNVASSFETVGYDGTFATSFVSENKTYKIPYTLIYPSQDAYKNERLQFRNDTYNKTTYKIPDLPSDASTKNYALNSVNGALTWNTIGNGLEIKDGALQEKVLNVSVSMTAEQLSQSINNSGVETHYTEENKAIVFDFIKAQCGIMRLTVNTPVGNLCMTLRPSLWKDDTNHSYNFEGSLYIETDLSAIGAKYFNQIIVRAICWDTNNSVSFRPTIIPIGDN